MDKRLHALGKQSFALCHVDYVEPSNSASFQIKCAEVEPKGLGSIRKRIFLKIKIVLRLQLKFVIKVVEVRRTRDLESKLEVARLKV